MGIIDFPEQNSTINQYLAEIRDKDCQKNRLFFHNDVIRVGEFGAFETSKTLNYESKDAVTPLGMAQANIPAGKIVLATTFRAGLSFHNGFLNVFDHTGNAFVSAYREYTDIKHHEVSIHVEYFATPDINGETLIIAGPTLATGGSMKLGYGAILLKGTPRCVYVVYLLATPEGIAHIRKTFPEGSTIIWYTVIDEGLSKHKYTVPGFGDTGDLCCGEKS